MDIANTATEPNAKATANDGLDRQLLLGRPHQRHGALWLTAAIVLFVIFLVGYSLVTNPRFEWNIVFGWFTSERLFTGLLRTLGLTAISMVVGIVVGVLLALARLAPNFIVAGAAAFLVCALPWRSCLRPAAVLGLYRRDLPADRRRNPLWA
ncbi:hypothetical protein [Arthrobacter sp. SLBN-112]|uniref:hypothetical protein n=1 Tax=Arthrobacter sp. SLBN-112 TaxID=2768452 RepID=UPI002810D559|nr:hypothetical protein [Arthrobacter sp. SLBN-112]